LQQPRFVSVVPPADGALTDRLVLLKPSVRSEQELPEQLQSMLKEGTANMVQHEITLDYDYWSAGARSLLCCRPRLILQLNTRRGHPKVYPARGRGRAYGL